MTDDKQVFWMVWSPQGHPPIVRHDHHAKAINEAERLARANPGREFYVLQATDLRMADGMTRIRLEPEHPF